MNFKLTLERLRILLSTDTGSQFQQNFMKVAKANVFALALPALAAPLLSRLFSPEDFAVLAVFASALAIILSVSTFRFDWVLPNSENADQAACLFAAGLIVLSVCCLATAAIAAFRPPILFEDSPLSQLGWLAILLPIALLPAAMRELYVGWFVWQGDLSAVSRSTITQSVVNVVGMIVTGMATLGATGLVAALIMSSYSGFTAMYRSASTTLGKSFSEMNWSGLKSAVRRHFKTATISSVVSFGNAASLYAPVLLLAATYAPREVGWFVFVQRLIGAPMGTLTSALAKSFWSRAAELARSSAYAELSALYQRTTWKLIIASIPVTLVCFAGPLYVGPLFGTRDWGEAGYVLFAMTPLLVGTLVFSPTNHVVVLEKKHLQLYADGLRLLLTVVSVWGAEALGLSFFWAVALVSISSFIGHLFLFLAHIYAHRKYF